MDKEQMQEQIEQRPYLCYHCRRVIGVCTDTVLIIGAARFNRSITIECGYCRRTTFFKPSRNSSGC